MTAGSSGCPPPFTALCYVLSGGLPRDLLRVARAIFTTCEDRARTQLELAEATHNVINDEIRALKHRASKHSGLHVSEPFSS